MIYGMDITYRMFLNVDMAAGIVSKEQSQFYWLSMGKKNYMTIA